MVTDDTQVQVDSSDGDAKVVQPETSTAEGDKTQEVTWEERATKAEAQVVEQTTRIAKQADDLRSSQGQVRRQISIEDRFQELTDSNAATQAEMRSGFKSIAGGDLETMDANMEAARAPHVTRSRGNTAKRLRDSGMEDFRETLEGADGNPLLDADAASELQEARETFNVAVGHLNNGDLALWHEYKGIAVNQARRQALATERAVSKNGQGDVEAATKTAVAKALEEAGAEDLSTGTPSGGGGSLEGEQLEEAIGAGTIEMTPEVSKKLNDYYKKVGFRR